MYLELAKKYLEKARASTGSTRQYFANLCQVCLAKEGIAPTEIGTTHKELVELQSGSKASSKLKKRLEKNTKEEYIKKCKEYLKRSKETQGATRQYYANICQLALAKYGISPTEIGTTEKELKNLQRRGLLESALKYLEQAKKSRGIKRKCYADLCKEFLKKAKASPLDIGTTLEELNKLSK